MHPRVKYEGKSPHGSSARYVWELKNGGACPVCREGNRKRAADRRDRARRAENERLLAAAGVSDSGGLDPADLPDVGPLEREVMRDLAGVTGRGTGTMRQTALALAREIDSLTSRQGKAQLAKQLGEVMARLAPPSVDTANEFDLFVADLHGPLTVDPGAELDPWSAEANESHFRRNHT
jgi:hypothetical protein